MEEGGDGAEGGVVGGLGGGSGGWRGGVEVAGGEGGEVGF